MARHPVARVPRGEPDTDVVVVRDVEHQSAFPSLESGRCQAEEAEQLGDGDDRCVIRRASGLPQCPE
eukprot:2274627-Heterocapsa_arctica.AAC.1